MNRQLLTEVSEATLDAILLGHLRRNLLAAPVEALSRERLEARREPLSGQQRDWTGRRAGPRPVHQLTPHVLVAKERADERGQPACQASGGRAGAAVVHDGTDFGQEPLVRARAHLKAEGLAAHLELRPARLHEHAPAGGARRPHDNERERGRLLNDHRAEADEDGRRIALAQPLHQ